MLLLFVPDLQGGDPALVAVPCAITLVTPRLWLRHGDSGACHREEPVSETRGPWKELQRSVQVSPKSISVPLRQDFITQIVPNSSPFPQGDSGRRPAPDSPAHTG